MEGFGRHRPVPLGHEDVRGCPLFALQAPQRAYLVALHRVDTRRAVLRPADVTFLPRTLSIALQLLPFNAACVVPIPRAFCLRTFKREWPRRKPLHLCLMFNSAVRTWKPHQVGPDAGEGRVVNIKLKVNWLSGLSAPANEIAHRVARNSQERGCDFLAAFLLLGRPHRAS